MYWDVYLYVYVRTIPAITLRADRASVPEAVNAVGEASVQR